MSQGGPSRLLLRSRRDHRDARASASESTNTHMICTVSRVGTHTRLTRATRARADLLTRVPHPKARHESVLTLEFEL